MAALAAFLTPTLPARAATSEDALRAALTRAIRPAGAASGALVVDLDTGRTLFSSRAGTRRVPASVEKLYTTATALLRLGPNFTISTAVAGDGVLDPNGTYRGNLYLKGQGDPTFGSSRFTRAAYGTGARITTLAARVADAGIERVDGRVYGDESFFDSRRGPPSSRFAVSRWVGPLSALTFDRGLAPGGRGFVPSPATYAAQRLVAALRKVHVQVPRRVGLRAAPEDAAEIAAVTSPSLATLVRLTNRPSDNFFAEMLLKGLGARFGSRGSTAAGAAVVRRELADLGIGAQVVDGSGLSYLDRTSPRAVVALLQHMTTGPAAQAFLGSLSVAGRNGTLRHRTRGTAAQDNCQGKTGTLLYVSNVAGYCIAADGDTLAFAILMNRVWPPAAHVLQDRMAAAIARYDGDG